MNSPNPLGEEHPMLYAVTVCPTCDQPQIVSALSDMTCSVCGELMCVGERGLGRLMEIVSKIRKEGIH